MTYRSPVPLQPQRRGLGAALLRDVLLRSVAGADEIGTRALVLHAESGNARNYSLHALPDFVPSPTDPLHQVLLAKDLRQTLRP